MGLLGQLPGQSGARAVVKHDTDFDKWTRAAVKRNIDFAKWARAVVKRNIDFAKWARAVVKRNIDFEKWPRAEVKRRGVGIWPTIWALKSRACASKIDLGQIRGGCKGIY